MVLLNNPQEGLFRPTFNRLAPDLKLGNCPVLPPRCKSAGSITEEKVDANITQQPQDLQPPALGRQLLPMVAVYSDLLSLWAGHTSATLTALALFPTVAFSFRISPAFLTTLLPVGDQISFLLQESCPFIYPYCGLRTVVDYRPGWIQASSPQEGFSCPFKLPESLTSSSFQILMLSFEQPAKTS